MVSAVCPHFSARAETGIPYQDPSSCPSRQFAQIQRAYPSLASTGCTPKFCQSGRMKHTDEERVGRNQPIESVLGDAADFLHQARQAGILASEEALNSRTRKVTQEIRENATHSRYTAVEGAGAEAVETRSLGLVGGSWTQTPEELEFGIRQAWKHSRRCIMRSEYKDLKLCDLRHVKTSAAMGAELISALETAFNRGEIRPTVFVFPPRGPNERGPMVWNSNLLSFAGYTQEDGSVLGDPMNVDLTSAIIELGWKPPTMRTRWDVLPIVTMAQGDEPVITEVPQSKFPLVPIQHPRHQLAFDKLGLRWVPAPVLSRLGFSIGGVQYTAAPFIGWFMDAEIGARNLVDPFRYNVLPELIKKMGWCDGDLDDLPDFEKLALMSRAQTEINYAVSWSFAKSKVRMIDSLSASEVFSRFDDEHLAEHGYRLPSDPYWLAPPMGSIIPLWHRGGSPNYQPKPMVCHHAQDPVKAWQRERGHPDRGLGRLKTSKLPVELAALPRPGQQVPRTFVGFCSSGTVALKMCKKLYSLLLETSRITPSVGQVMPIQPLNKLKKIRFTPDDRIIIVASNVKKGEVPLNGTEFLKALENNELSVASTSFAIFGNGSRDYPGTFNRAAELLESLLRKGGAVPLVGTARADTASENPPWSAFDQFYRELVQSLTGTPPEARGPGAGGVISQLTMRDTETFFDAKDWIRGNFTTEAAGGTDKSHRMKLVEIDVGARSYTPMSYVSILPPNTKALVQGFVQAMGIDAGERLAFMGNMTAWDFLHLYADIETPFKSMNWAAKVPLLGNKGLTELACLPSYQAITSLPKNWQHWVSLQELCRAIPSIQPRKYSIASDFHYTATVSRRENKKLELMVQHHDGGRFSDRFLNSIQAGRAMAACRIEGVSHLHRLATAVTRPLVLFCTGSGIAPIRSLLKYRISLLKQARSMSPKRVINGRRPKQLASVEIWPQDDSAFGPFSQSGYKKGAVVTIELMPSAETSEEEVEEEMEFEMHAPITLLAGYKPKDAELVQEVVSEARALGLLDLVRLMPSNTERRRAQDAVFEEGDGMRQKILEKLLASDGDGNGGMVFACARAEAEEDFRGNLGALLGVADVRDALGERYVADVFQAAV